MKRPLAAAAVLTTIVATPALAEDLAPIDSALAWRRAERVVALEQKNTPEVARIDSRIALLEERARSEPRVTLTVSVDWEGRVLAAENLAAMRDFRAALPAVPLTHFLNAAYQTKPGAKDADVAALVRSVLRPHDELGLHVHAWRSLIEASGVRFRTEPTFWGKPLVIPETGEDVGHEVELCAYSREEVEKIVAESRRRLEAAGFAIGSSFRCGGWLAAPNILAAIRAHGFLVDTSATDTRWLTPRLGDLPIVGRIRELWPTTDETSTPRWIATPSGAVLEMPDTGALADYVSVEDMLGHVERACARARASPAREVFVHLGFHQETAARYSGRVRQVLEQLASRAEVKAVTLEEAAERARAFLPVTAATSSGR